jgi:hypothetical protein
LHVKCISLSLGTGLLRFVIIIVAHTLQLFSTTYPVSWGLVIGSFSHKHGPRNNIIKQPTRVLYIAWPAQSFVIPSCTIALMNPSGCYSRANKINCKIKADAVSVIFFCFSLSPFILIRVFDHQLFFLLSSVFSLTVLLFVHAVWLTSADLT